MRSLLAVMLLFAASTGTPGQNSESKKAQPENWKISGWETTTCCCKDICPCRYNEKPTHMECEGTISIHIDKGTYGKTSLDDVNFVVISRGFDIATKGWNKLYIDQRATPDQQKAVLGILGTVISSYKPETAQLVFGAESKGLKLVPMTFSKSKDGLIREVKVPGVCNISARLGKVPGSKMPMHVLDVLTEFSPIFYPAAEVTARVDTAEVPFDHPDHHRAEVEDFTLTRDDIVKKRLGFQAYTGRGGCLLPK